MSKPKVAINPKDPERICWGCDKYCSADDLRCGNGTIRTQHPVELFGEDWLEWELTSQTPAATVNAQQNAHTKPEQQAMIDRRCSHSMHTQPQAVE